MFSSHLFHVCTWNICIVVRNTLTSPAQGWRWRRTPGRWGCVFCLFHDFLASHKLCWYFQEVTIPCFLFLSFPFWLLSTLVLHFPALLRWHLRSPGCQPPLFLIKVLIAVFSCFSCIPEILNCCIFFLILFKAFSKFPCDFFLDTWII